MLFLQNFSYMVELAKLFGTNTAILIACIDAQYLYQLRNNKLNDNNTVSISRSEIYEITGLSDSEQIDAEMALTQCGIIIMKPFQNVPNKSYYIIDRIKLEQVLTAENPAEAVNQSTIANQFIRGKRVEPTTKRQTHIAQLKKKIKVEDPVIQDYLIQWIDAVYSNPKGFLSPSSVVIAQQELMEYCKDNQEKQIKVLKEAIKGGCRDMTWAIQNYEKNNNIDSRNFVSYSDTSAVKGHVSSDEVF